MANTVGQVPRVHSGSTVDDFFDNLEKKASSLVTWHGELYFELHRGVYTTQASQKSNNRKSEFLLRDIELLATIASIQDSSYRYPKKELDEMWQGVLLCQFHDCLPGSAIKMCYDDSNEVSLLARNHTLSVSDITADICQCLPTWTQSPSDHLSSSRRQ